MRLYEPLFTHRSTSGEMDFSGLVENFPDLSPKTRDILNVLQSDSDHAAAVKEITRKYPDFTELLIVLLNTRFYELPQPVNTIREALKTPGPVAILELSLLVSLIIRLYDNKDAEDLLSFWKHSFACGSIGRFISEKIETGDSGKIYIAGLFHDLGKLVLNRNYPIDFLKIINHIKEKKVSFLEAEEAQIGITHCQIGSGLAQKWGLDEEITEVLRQHHSVNLATRNPALVMLINLANLIVRTHFAGFELLENLPVSLEELNEQKSWEILLKKNDVQLKIDLEQFFDEIENRLDRINFLIEDIFEIIRVKNPD